MALTLKELVVKISADLSGFEKQFSKAEKAVRDIGQGASRTGRALTTGLTLPLAGLGAATVKFAADMDSLKRGLTAVTGSASAAESEFAQLKEVAKLPGLGLREAVEGATNLQAAGFSADLATRALKGFGNALATVGRGRDDLQGVILALGQIASKGKISAEEINQLAERVPQIRQVMKDAFGTADTQQLQKAGIGAQEFVSKVVTELEKLPPVTGGAANSIENLRDSFFQAAAAIGDKLLPAVLPLLDGLSRVSSWLTTLNPETVRWGIALAGVAALSGPFLTLTGAVLRATTALKVLFALETGVALAGMATGIGAVVVALGALSAWFFKTKLDALSAKDAVEEFKDSLVGMKRDALESSLALASRNLGEVTDQINRLETRLVALRRVSKDEGTTFSNRANAIHEIAQDEFALKNLKKLRDQFAEEFRSSARALSDLTDREQPSTPPALPAAPLSATEMDRRLSAQVEEIYNRLLNGVLRRIEGPNGGTVVGTLKNPDRLGRLAGNNDTRAFRPSQLLGKEISVPVQHTVDVPKGPDYSGLLGQSPLGAIKGALSSVGGAIGSQIMGLVAQFGPLALAAAALKPVFDGLRKVIGPVLEKLARPLEVMGEIIGEVIAPVLELLEEPLKAIATLFSVLIQPLKASITLIVAELKPGLKLLGGVLKVVTTAFSYFTEGLGLLIYNLAHVIDKLIPFGDPLKSIEKAGKEMIDSSRRARQGFDAVAEAADGAAEAANKVAESLSNVPRVLPLALLRFQAASGGGIGGSAGRGGGIIGDPIGGPRINPTPTGNHFHFERGAVQISGANKSAAELLDELGTEAINRSRRGGVPPFLVAT